MMKQRNHIQTKAGHTNRGGFTLIELMVSVTITMIIMVMFAQIYGLATDTVSEQKGIRRNDQRARMLSIVLRGDLRNRTFVDVIPFRPGQRTDIGFGPSYVPERRRGYFSISENDPNNPRDDVLAFTVEIPKDGSQAPYFGQTVTLVTKKRARAAGLGFPAPAKEPGKTKWFQDYMKAYPNQLEFDDGNPFPNGTGTSKAAEIVYFLRNGNLYRRVLLLREPYQQNGETLVPAEVEGEYGSIAGGGAVSGIFWEDFAFNGFHKFAGDSVAAVRFHSADESLKNENPATNIVSDIKVPASLGIPHLRYGSSPSKGTLPREYIGFGANRKFIGRFLHQETADRNFLYPGRIKTPIDKNDPHIRRDLTDSNNDGVIDQYSSNRTRRGEDILMTNVHEFDIKVWDAARRQFVNLGNGGGGNYGTSARGTGVWNRYDTWHPFRHPTSGWDLKQPPYRPIKGAGRLGYRGEEVPLRAIQITIRFFDISTDRMRQVTIVQSLID